MSHVNFKTINSLSKRSLVRGLPPLSFQKDRLCGACEKGKGHRTTFKTKQANSIKRCFHLLHMDLFGPVNVQSLRGSRYTLVIVDEYSRHTWTFFLRSKSDADEEIIKFIKRMENLNSIRVKELRSDHGIEFRNHTLDSFCADQGISQNFSSVRTPEQNGVAERRNRTLIEAARTMLSESNLPSKFWAETVNTACHTQNRCIIVKRHDKTAYEVLRGKKPQIGYFNT